MILNAVSITCRRGGIDVLRGLRFTLSGGQIMAVTGANGSGKSTLLRTLGGLNTPVSGTLTLNDKDFETDLRRDTAHWVGPDLALKPGLSLIDNLRFWMVVQGGQANDDSILKALHRFDIAHLSDRLVNTLSSGQKRRAAMARLFLTPRPIWLLDEPEAALDKDGRESMLQALHEHCGDGGAAIIATHDAHLWQPTLTLDIDAKGEGHTAVLMPPSDTPQTPPTLHNSPLSVVMATLRRDLTLARHGKAECLQPVLLFLLMVMLFPLSLGPNAATLAPIAGGLMMIAAFFAALLPLERIFSDDAADGTLDTLMTTPAPLPAFVAGRMAAHWLCTGLPLVIVAPLAALMLGLPAAQINAVAMVMVPVTLLFTLIGTSISALVLSARRGAMLLALLTAPLYIPVLIFGSAALNAVGGDLPLLLLWAIVAVLLPLSPMIASGCLHLMKD